MLPTVEETRGYDFQDPENVEKWRGVFINPLRKVLDHEHPTLTAEESALQYVESLCLRLLALLCAVPSPLTVQDVEERVARTFPTPLDKWAITEARDLVTIKRRKPMIPCDKLHQLLQKEVLLYKIDVSVSQFITAVLEFMSSDILRLAGNYVKKISQKSGYDTITCRDIKTAMCADKVLMDMFYQESELTTSETSGGGSERRGRRGSLSYAELVRDLLTDEKHFLRDLNLIIRVFKDELEKILDKDSRAISLIFGNIVDIYELTVTLLGNLEDAMEMSQDSPTPYIGSCFEELAEVEEFRAYVRYANIVTRKESRDALQAIVDDPVLSERLDTAGHGFRLAVKYYLPKLLLAPVAHVFLYHNYVLALLQIAPASEDRESFKQITPASEDRESFKQVECNLHPIKKLLIKALGNGPKLDATLRMAHRARRQLAIEKCNELARIVDNWDVRDIGQCCNEFIREDTLSKIGPGKRIAERRAYLFDGLLLLCKPITSIVVNSGGSGGAGGGAQQLKLKEKLHIRKLELVDRPDTDEGRHMVELCPRVGPCVVLACASCAEKRNWMCDLVMLNTKPMLDRFLDSILLDLERRHPLKLPPASLYRFAVPDSPDNILLEDNSAARHHGNAPVPLIKGATLLKLVERLTYHIYADLNLVRTFLTTYRSFCSPGELLELLIERFKIPEPSEVYDTPRTVPRIKTPKKDVSPNSSLLDIDLAESIESVASSDAEKLSKNTAREDWKRYRKEFQQPVKFRVINVLRHWVDQHFYDFEREPALLQRLRDFLESVDGKPMKKWVQSVLKTLQRKSQPPTECEALGGSVSHVFDRLPPTPLRHVAEPERFAWHPLALHPLELARQLTLLEFHLYRQVKPSELVGAVWTKKDKEKTSPNLLRIIKHTTNFTRWMEKWIVESENLEERVGVLCRVLELSVALRQLNNFNGVLAVVAACGSASVHRLRATFQLLPPRLSRALDEFRELNSDHFRRYQEKLRSINPPCVPFFGMYLTNILHIEEGNLDYLPDSELINFSKRRKVAEITGEIQQYQNQPYCLTVEPKTRAFLESLDPFPGKDDNEITNYLYAKSLEIEPRLAKQLPKFPRKYPELSPKPLKVSRRAAHEAGGATNNSCASSMSSSASHSDDTMSMTSQISPTSISTWDGGSLQSLPLDLLSGSKQELVSPRLERGSLSQLSQLLFFDKNKPNHNHKNSTKDEPPSPRDRHSPRHDRQWSSCERRTLSPRNPIVDADLFYSTRGHTAPRRPDPERVPPLLPRGEPDRPPAPPRRPCSPSHSYIPSSTCEPPPEPPDRPQPSPKHELFKMPAVSPKRSPAPQPPASPHLPADSRGGVAFKFEWRGAPTPSPPAPPLTPHLPVSCGTPPPLPPRRRRDSAAPPTPLPHSSVCAGSPPAAPAPPVAGAGSVCATGAPPPLPPRPAPPPELLRPAHSTILQRRHNNTGAPRLPPKPAAANSART
ncbi:protein son of sevenless isoform X3 [Spodoptera frugiperda]|uniref:Protein son of sevenless isoform X3 n=1 Tax=Spodoptera frugiperda TaxID=7108 RepID=A0A9R0E2K7_SPOFR|nr:protein son of sevenless isoform X3 [Spodoptera frugiperda]